MADRLKDQLKRMSDINLRQQQTIRQYERLLEDIGDEQMVAGVSAETFRTYFPGYLSPTERKTKDQQQLAARPLSKIPKERPSAA